MAWWAVCISSPIVGMLGGRFSAKILCVVGGYIQAVSAFLLGMLAYVEGKNEFLAGSYILR